MLLAKAACVCVIASCVECVVFFRGRFVCVRVTQSLDCHCYTYWDQYLNRLTEIDLTQMSTWVVFFFHMCVCNRCGWTRARNKDIPCGGLCCLIWCEPQSMRIGPHAPTKKNTHTFIHLICEEYKHVANPSTTSLWHKRTKAKE